MNKDIILQSNLLDIIFDDRNKDYGAYILRKEYNARMRIAVFGMIGISIIFCVAFLFFNPSKGTIKSVTIFIPPGTLLSPYNPKPFEVNKKMATPLVKHKISSDQLPPKIEKDFNTSPATPIVPEQSLTGISNSQIDIPSDVQGSSNGNGVDPKVNATLPVSTKPEKPIVVDVAEIMPEYPGGLKALLAFLQKNIHSPQDIDGDDVAVKVKFVVNYNGKLEGFNVIQSGGEVFDNEVLRVLKKMPLWNPGKSKGENVSVYYVVPVKFTKEF